MITLTRRQARRLRGIFRRSVLGISHRGAIPPLVLRAEGTQLRAQYRYKALAIEHVEQGTHHPHGAIALPLDALAEFEGHAESSVVLEAAAPDRTVVRWEDHGTRHTREFAVQEVNTLGAFPGSPASWSNGPPGLLDALAEATATSADENTRYALDCLRLRGADGTVGATDGRQLLVREGFHFPWPGDVLVRRSPIFACRDLPRDQALSLGKTDTHVVLRAGPWTLHLEIQANARFPKIDEVIPDARSAATRLCLDAGDAAFLTGALDRLPGADEANAPATLDLNGKIAVRARGKDDTSVTELVLARSSYSGSPVRLNTNREMLGRAIRLGFGAIEIVDNESPIVARDGHRVFCWQPLSNDSSIEPTDDVTRLFSDSPALTTTAARNLRPSKASTTVNVNERSTPVTSQLPSKDDPGAQGHAAPEGPAPASLVSLITETEGLHECLSDARARTARLMAALRRHRKRERLMASALDSLKQLKLQEVAG